MKAPARHLHLVSIATAAKPSAWIVGERYLTRRDWEKLLLGSLILPVQYYDQVRRPRVLDGEQKLMFARARRRDQRIPTERRSAKFPGTHAAARAGKVVRSRRSIGHIHFWEPVRDFRNRTARALEVIAVPAASPAATNERAELSAAIPSTRHLTSGGNLSRIELERATGPTPRRSAPSRSYFPLPQQALPLPQQSLYSFSDPHGHGKIGCGIALPPVPFGCLRPRKTLASLRVSTLHAIRVSCADGTREQMAGFLLAGWNGPHE